MADTFYWSGFTHATQDGALVYIENTEQTARDRLFRIESLTVKPYSPDTPSRYGPWQLRWVSAVDDAAGITIPLTHFGATDNLPSEVVCKIQAPVTLHASSGQATALRRFIPPGWFSTVTSHYLAQAFSYPESIYTSGYGSPDVTGLVLTEGNGICITTAGNFTDGLPASTTLWCSVQLTDTTNSRDYGGVFELNPLDEATASFVLFNGSGSGVTLQLKKLSFSMTGDMADETIATNSPGFRIIRTPGIAGDVFSAVAETPVSYNPAVSVPSELRILRGTMNRPITPRLNFSGDISQLGYPATNSITVRNLGAFRRVSSFRSATFNPSGPLGIPFASAPTFNGGGFDSKDGNYGIICTPGQGVAVVVNNMSAYNSYWVEAVITHIPPATGGGGAVARAYA